MESGALAKSITTSQRARERERKTETETYGASAKTGYVLREKLDDSRFVRRVRVHEQYVAQFLLMLKSEGE